MGLCDLCGERASWLQNRHPACNEWLLELELKKPLRDLVFNGTLNGQTYEALDREVQEMTSRSKLPHIKFQEQILQAANDAAAQLAQQEPISADEFERLVAILRGFSNDSYTRESVQRRWFGMPALGMSFILWQVREILQESLRTLVARVDTIAAGKEAIAAVHQHDATDPTISSSWTGACLAWMACRPAVISTTRRR